MSQSHLLAELEAGRAVDDYREGGNSMIPIIKSQQPVRVEPLGTRELSKGDVVFAKVNGRFYLHKIHALNKDSVLIGNNRGRMNGWTPRTKVYGIVTKVHPKK